MKKPFNLRKKATNPAAIGVPQPYNAPNKQYHSPAMIFKEQEPEPEPVKEQEPEPEPVKEQELVKEQEPVKEKEPVAPVEQPVEPETSGIEFGDGFNRAVQQYLASFIVPGNPFAKKPAPLPQGWDDRNSKVEPGIVFEEFSLVAKKILESRPYNFGPAVIEKIIDSCFGQGINMQDQLNPTQTESLTSISENLKITPSLLSRLDKEQIELLKQELSERGVPVEIREKEKKQDVYPISYVTKEGLFFGEKFQRDIILQTKVENIIKEKNIVKRVTDDIAKKTTIKINKKDIEKNKEDIEKSILAKLARPKGLGREEHYNFKDKKVTRYKDFSSAFFTQKGNERYLPSGITKEDVDNMMYNDLQSTQKKLTESQIKENKEKSQHIRMQLNSVIIKLIEEGNEDLIVYLANKTGNEVMNDEIKSLKLIGGLSVDTEFDDGSSAAGEIAAGTVDERSRFAIETEEQLMSGLSKIYGSDNETGAISEKIQIISSDTITSLGNEINSSKETIGESLIRDPSPLYDLPIAEYVSPADRKLRIEKTKQKKLLTPEQKEQERIQEKARKEQEKAENSPERIAKEKAEKAELKIQKQKKSIFKKMLQSSRNLDLLQILLTATDIQVKTLFGEETEVKKEKRGGKEYWVINTNKGGLVMDAPKGKFSVDSITGQVDWEKLVKDTYTMNVYRQLIAVKKEVLKYKGTVSPEQAGESARIVLNVKDPILQRMLSDPEFIKRTWELDNANNIDLGYGISGKDKRGKGLATGIKWSNQTEKKEIGDILKAEIAAYKEHENPELIGKSISNPEAKRIFDKAKTRLKRVIKDGDPAMVDVFMDEIAVKSYRSAKHFIWQSIIEHLIPTIAKKEKEIKDTINGQTWESQKEKDKAFNVMMGQYIGERRMMANIIGTPSAYKAGGDSALPSENQISESPEDQEGGQEGGSQAGNEKNIRLSRLLSDLTGTEIIITTRDAMKMFTGHMPIPEIFASPQAKMAMAQYDRNIKFAIKLSHATTYMSKFAMKTNYDFSSLLDDYFADIDSRF